MPAFRIVGAAVKLVGAALRRKVVDSAAADAAILSREIRGLESELLDGFHRRLDLVGYLGGVRIVGLLAFEHDLEINRASIDGDVVPAVEIGARRHLDKRQRVPDRTGADAEINGKLSNLVACDRHGLLGILTFQEGRFRGHRDRFGGRPNLKHHVNAGGDSDLHLYIGLFVFAEARLLDSERVSAYRQLQQRVVTGSSGDGVGLRTRLRIGKYHLDARNQRAGGIRNRPRNCAAIALGS